MTSRHFLEVARTLAGHASRASGKLVLTGLRWFWQLTIGGKIAATAVEIVALYVVVTRMPLAREAGAEPIAGGSLALMFLLICGVLLTSARPR